jgi:large subunit ribosomal protein L7A
MISELNAPNKVVGAKQAKRALNDGRACKVFLAADADPRVTEPLRKLAAEKGVPVEDSATMKELGAVCGIAVGSAAAVLVG